MPALPNRKPANDNDQVTRSDCFVPLAIAIVTLVLAFRAALLVFSSSCIVPASASRCATVSWSIREHSPE